MNLRIRSLFTIVTLFAWLATSTETASAEKPRPNSDNFHFITTGQVVGISLGIAAVGGVIGASIYYARKHKKNVTGCVTNNANGLALTDEGDHQTYSLIGDVAGVQAGDRVRISGKRQKRQKDEPRQFLVETMSQDLGGCNVSATVR